MPGNQPFEPDIRSGVAGFTQICVIATATAVNFTFNEPTANSLLVQGINSSPAGSIPCLAYLRLSVESSTSNLATASTTDTAFPIMPQGANVHLFASPNPGGKYQVAVFITVSPSLGGSQWQIFMTPGIGGT